MEVMRKSEVKAGDWVIRQGDKGDQFYIIEKGVFEVRVNQDKEIVTDPKDAGEVEEGIRDRLTPWEPDMIYNMKSSSQKGQYGREW